MRIPNHIMVMGKKIKIKKVKSWDGHIDASKFMVGRYYPDTKTIYISINYNIQTQYQFLLHEINHVIMDIVGIDQNITLDLQECIAQSFATFYFDWARL